MKTRTGYCDSITRREWISQVLVKLIGCCGQEIKYPTTRDAAVENPSVYSIHKCFDDPLRPSNLCARKHNESGDWAVQVTLVG